MSRVAGFDGVRVRSTGELLPAWAITNVDLGAGVASCRNTRNSLVVAVALPTRAYAAAFIASGVVLQRAAAQTSLSLDDHIDHLLELLDQRGPVPVRIIYGQNTGTTGLFDGLEDLTEGLYLRVLIPKHSPKLLPFDQGLRIQPAGRLKYAGQVRPIVAKGRDFVASVLAPIDCGRYVTTSQLECVIVGVEARICNEIEDRAFQLGPHVGCLQDVLRVRRCCPSGESYRSEVLSDRNAPFLRDEKPHVVIFDGAPAYLKWRQEWHGIPWVVLLDRTEMQFDDAVSQVNLDYLQRVGDAVPLDLSYVPTGVEIMAFGVKGS